MMQQGETKASMGALCAAQEEMPNMWLHRMAYLSVALVCRELRYAVIVCDNVRAHPAAQHNMVSTILPPTLSR